MIIELVGNVSAAERKAFNDFAENVKDAEFETVLSTFLLGGATVTGVEENEIHLNSDGPNCTIVGYLAEGKFVATKKV